MNDFLTFSRHSAQGSRRGCQARNENSNQREGVADVERGKQEVNCGNGTVTKEGPHIFSVLTLVAP